MINDFINYYKEFLFIYFGLREEFLCYSNIVILNIIHKGNQPFLRSFFFKLLFIPSYI